MAEIRKYEKGDIESIAFNVIGAKEWKKAPRKACLIKGEAYTIIIGKYKCVLCVEYVDGAYNIWFTPDKRISPLYIKYARWIIDKVAERGLPMFTLSEKGKMQTKMHKFLGCKAIGEEDGKTIWLYVKERKQYNG